MGTNLQAFLHPCLKTQKQQLHFVKKKKKFNYKFFFYSGRALYNRAARKTVRAGRRALRNMPSWNTASDVVVTRYAAHQSVMQRCVARDRVSFVAAGRLVSYKNNNKLTLYSNENRNERNT